MGVQARSPPQATYGSRRLWQGLAWTYAEYGKFQAIAGICELRGGRREESRRRRHQDRKAALSKGLVVAIAGAGSCHLPSPREVRRDHRGGGASGVHQWTHRPERSVQAPWLA